MRSAVPPPPPSLAPYIGNHSASRLLGNGATDGNEHRAVASFSGSQGILNQTNRSDASLLSATELTLQSSCRCPHLDAILPHVLRLDRYDPIVELHLGRHFGDIAPLSCASSNARAAAAAASAAATTAPAPAASSSGNEGSNDMPSLSSSRAKCTPNPATQSTQSCAIPPHLPNIAAATVTAKSKRADRAVFGPEHARLLAVTGRGGAATTWCPVLPPLYQPSGSAGRRYNSANGDGSDKNSGEKRKKKSKALKAGSAAVAAVAAVAVDAETPGGATPVQAGVEETATKDEYKSAAATQSPVSSGDAAAKTAVVAETGVITSVDNAAAAADASAEAVRSTDPTGSKAASESMVIPPSTATGTSSQSVDVEYGSSSAERKKEEIAEGCSRPSVPSPPDTPAGATTSCPTEVSGKEETTFSMSSQEKEKTGNDSEALGANVCVSQPEYVSSDATKTDEQKETKSGLIISSTSIEVEDVKASRDAPDCSSAEATAAFGATVKNETSIEETSGPAPMEVESLQARDIEASNIEAVESQSSTAGLLDTDMKATSDILNHSPQGEGFSSQATDNLVKNIVSAGTEDLNVDNAVDKGGARGDVEGRGGEEGKSTQDVAATAMAATTAAAVAQGAQKDHDANVADFTAKEIVSHAPYSLSDSRYAQLRSRERRITRERENVLFKPREVPSLDGFCVSSGSTQKQINRPTKRRKNDTGTNAVTNTITTLTPIHVVSDDELSFERELLRSRASAASSRVEEWLEVIRDGRKAHYDEGRIKHSRHLCAWCPCPSNKRECVTFRVPSGDELMQCLECAVVGCGPTSTFPDTSMHMMCHFMASGHNFGEFLEGDLSCVFWSRESRAIAHLSYCLFIILYAFVRHAVSRRYYMRTEV